MDQRRILGQTIEAIEDGKAKYDEVCKAILRDRYILANLLKYVVQEYADCSIEEIADRYIEPDTIRSLYRWIETLAIVREYRILFKELAQKMQA